MKAPKIPSFIRQNQPNGYTPRYRFYDPAKERREQRERLYGKTEDEKSENETNENAQSVSQERVRDNFRSKVEKNRHVKSSSSSSRTLIIFILVLLVAVIWMLKTNLFERIMTSFMNM